MAWARVRVEGRTVGECGPGMLVLVCAMRGDGEAEADRLAARIAGYRFFAEAAAPGESACTGESPRPDEAGAPHPALGPGRMGRSAAELGLAALVVSQVTLAADGRKGRRPSFDAAAPPERARELVLRFAEALRRAGLPTASGAFGAAMEVELLNAGPVTLLLEQQPPQVLA